MTSECGTEEEVEDRPRHSESIYEVLNVLIPLPNISQSDVLGMHRATPYPDSQGPQLGVHLAIQPLLCGHSLVCLGPASESVFSK